MTHEAAGPGLAEVETQREKHRRERRAVALTALDHLLTVAVKPYAGDRHSEMDLVDSAKKAILLIGEFESEANAADAEVERLHSALRAATAPQDGWQPIETAPKDGTPIWLIEDGKPLGLLVAHHVSGFWVPDARYQSGGYWAAVDSANVLHPSHWMPLPAAPQVAQEDDEEEVPHPFRSR